MTVPSHVEVMKASTTFATLVALVVSFTAQDVRRVQDANLPAAVVTVTAASAEATVDGPASPATQLTMSAAAMRTKTLTVAPNRSYLLTEPISGSATRLVVALHWSTGTGENIRSASGFDAMAQASGSTIVAYPDGIAKSWNAGGCCRQNEMDDVEFLDALIAAVKGRHPTIEHVVMFGQSNGGMMAYRYWLEGEHRISAFAVQAAAISEGGDLGDFTSVPYAAHLMHWHGALDTVVPLVGRESKDLSRAVKSPYCPLFATVSMAVNAADADLDRWRIRSDDSSVTVWKGTHRIRLRILPDSGHGGEGEPWPSDRYEFPWRWFMLRT